jgi:hypothetical protein
LYADATIQGDAVERMEIMTAEKAITKNGFVRGSALSNGNVWKKSASPRTVIPPVRKEQLAQKTAGSPPRRLVT